MYVRNSVNRWPNPMVFAQTNDKTVASGTTYTSVSQGYCRECTLHGAWCGMDKNNMAIIGGLGLASRARPMKNNGLVKLKVVSSVQECLDKIMNFLWLRLTARSNNE